MRVFVFVQSLDISLRIPIDKRRILWYSSRENKTKQRGDIVALNNEIDHEAVRQTQGLFEKELEFPNTLIWGGFTVKHPHNIIVTLYDFEEE